MKKGIKALIVLCTLFVGAGGMYLLMYFFPINSTTVAGKTIINKSEKEVTITDQGIADAVDKLYDAVVMVYNYQNNKLYGSGTGFVYKTNGDKSYILTNNHVIDSSTKVTVTISNEKEYEVKVLGSDAYYDLAVLEIDTENILDVASIGSSEDLRLGDTVFTIGAPLNSEYFGTVTRGIVSGKDRLLEVSVNSTYSSDYMVKVIQTDASINSGNSGGPLANANGEVVGITSMKLVSSGVEGMGFAIPIEEAIEYASVIESGKTVERPFLGISMYDVANQNSASNYYGYGYGYSSINIDKSLTEGVIVAEVQKGSPAETAKIEQYDVIVKFNGISIKNSAQLKYYLFKCNLNDTVEVVVNRQGKEKTLKIKLTEKAD